MRVFSIIVALLIASLLPASAWAQGRPAKGSNAAKTERRQKRAAKLRKKVGLTEAKARKVEQIVKKYRKEQRGLSRNMREARRDLGELFRNDSDDQQAYKKALAKLNGANKKLQGLRDKQFAELSQELTPKEQARLLVALHKLRKHMSKQRRGPKGRKAKKQKQKRPKQPKRPKRPKRPRGPKGHGF